LIIAHQRTFFFFVSRTCMAWSQGGITMLFRMKTTLSGTLILTFALFVASSTVWHALGLNLNVTWGENTLRDVIIALVVLLVGDGVVQGILRVIYGKRFQETFDTFLNDVVVGEWEVVLIVAVTAAMEEFFFRGVLAQGILQYGWGPVWMVILTTFISSLAHYFKRPGLNWWALTNWWEGLALGITYALTGSLITIMIVHAIHDVINGGVAIVLVNRIRARQPAVATR
jgi:membrane protease YdiL (CAAX protease family)